MKDGEMENFQLGVDDFSDLFSGKNLFESIDFGDLFVCIEDKDVLPDLEMDTEILADFSVSGGEEYSSEANASVSVCKEERSERTAETDTNSGSGLSHGTEIINNKKDEHERFVRTSTKESTKLGRKASAQSKGSQGKRKAKVDWTPELHRRFVQAVEQLGVDKAVPSRILELMGMDCLTRHNIASHLQKYRSHRKHLIAREAETASWSQRRQIYGGGSKRNMSSCRLPPPITVGFPPPSTLQPLHVWGHPTFDQSLIHMWPNHRVHSPSPPPHPWRTQPPPAGGPSHWQPLHHAVPSTQVLTPWTACFPQLLPTMRFSTPPVRSFSPPTTMHKQADQGIAIPDGHSVTLPQFDHPTEESIDAAIGEVLSKPCLPLPLGLKPPSIESVRLELQREGISKIPNTCASSPSSTHSHSKGFK